MEFNPNFANGILGPELSPRNGLLGQAKLPVLSPSQCVVERFASKATETVQGISKYLQPQTADAFGGAVMAEIINAGSEVIGPVTTTVFNPNGGTSSSIERRSTGLVDSSAWAGVNGADGGVFSLGGISTLNLEFATAGALVGQRVLSFRLKINGGYSLADGPAYLGISIGGSDHGYFVLPEGIKNAANFTLDLGEVWHVGPVKPTTIANIQSLDSGSPRITLTFNVLGTSGLEINVNQVWIEVDTCAENRQTVDIVPAGTGGPINRFWTVHKPDGTANWSKVNATNFSLVIRQPYTAMLPFGSLYNTYVLANPTFDDVPPDLSTIYLGASVGAQGGITDLGDPEPRRLFTETIFLNTVPTLTTESQAYARMVTTGDASWTVMRQRYTPSANFSPVGIRLIGDYIADPLTGLAETLTVNVKRVSDNALFCSGTLTQAQADAFPKDPGAGGLRVMTVPFSTLTTLVTGIAYYVEIVPATHPPVGWTFAYMQSTDGNGAGVTWKGTTNFATLNATADTFGDFPWLLYTAIAVPANFAVAPALEAVEPVTDCAPRVGGMSGIPYVKVTWTPTAIGTLFDHYVVQREDEWAEWQDVAYIDTEATAEWDDYEPRIGIPSSYRIQVITTVSIAGAFAPQANVTPPAAGVGLTFTTNFSPSAGVAYSDAYDGTATPERAFTSPEADEIVTQRLAGRDYVVAFQPCERRGDSFTRTLLLNALATPSVPGVHAFDALRDLAKAKVPYVCVRSEDGDRWFAVLAVPDFRIRNPRQFYFATVNVIEVQGTPSPTSA